MAAEVTKSKDPEKGTIHVSKEELQIFSGRTSNLPSLKSNIIRIFLSSTFSDFKVERNALMKTSIPKLKQYCREKYNYQFQVVDMRWGIPEEATVFHNALDLCKREVTNCQEISAGPNFVALIGNRYGTQNLLSDINEKEFSVLEKYASMIPNWGLLQEWYKKDENAVPPVYALQSLAEMGVDTHDWMIISGKLQTLVRAAVQKAISEHEISESDGNKYFESVTEAEIDLGICNYSEASSKSIALFRQIEDIDYTHPRIGRFVDVDVDGNVDDRSQRLLNSLKDNVKRCLPTDNVIQLSTKWESDGGINDDEYVEELCKNFEKKLCELIDKQVNQRQIDYSDNAKEVLQQSQQCLSKANAIIPRKDIMNELRQHLSCDSLSKPVVVYGSSGCGKTSILSSVVKDAPSWFGNETKIISRLLGTTPKSSSIHSVFESMIQQSEALLGQKTETPHEFPQLVRHFWNLTTELSRKGPLVVILDSIDQLRNDENCPYSMSWLPNTVASNVKLVLSSISENYDIVSNARMALKDLSPEFIEVKGLSAELSWTVVSKWLDESRRKLTEEQAAYVKLVLEDNPLPLFVKLVFDKIKTWKSSKVNFTFTTNISSIIDELFSSLEQKHGKVESEKILGYITLVPNGISETELEDILSLDDEYLTLVFKYHVPPVRRMPAILWSRMRNDIKEYIVEKEADGIPVISWYHRQFIEKAAERYIQSSCQEDLINTMESYFQGDWSNGRKKPFVYTEKQMKKLGLKIAESLADRNVPSQPTCFDIEQMKFNLRKIHVLSELWTVYNLAEKVSQNIVYDLEFLMGKLHNDSWSVMKSELKGSFLQLQETFGLDGSELDPTRTKDAKLIELGYVLHAILQNYGALTSDSRILGPFIFCHMKAYDGITPGITNLIGDAVSKGLSYNSLFPVYPFKSHLDPLCFLQLPNWASNTVEIVNMDNGTYKEVLVCMPSGNVAVLNLENNEEIFRLATDVVYVIPILTHNNEDLFIISFSRSVLVVISVMQKRIILDNEGNESEIPYFSADACKAFWKPQSSKTSPKDLYCLLYKEASLAIISLGDKAIIFQLTNATIYHANVFQSAEVWNLHVSTKTAQTLYEIQTNSSGMFYNVLPINSKPFKDLGCSICMYTRGSPRQKYNFDAFVCNTDYIHLCSKLDCSQWSHLKVLDTPTELYGIQLPFREFDCLAISAGRTITLYCTVNLERVLCIAKDCFYTCFGQMGLIFRVEDKSSDKMENKDQITIDRVQLDETTGHASCMRIAKLTFDGCDNVNGIVAGAESLFISSWTKGLSGWSLEKVLNSNSTRDDRTQDTADESDAYFRMILHPTESIVLLQTFSSSKADIFDIVTNTIVQTLTFSGVQSNDVESYFWASDKTVLCWLHKFKGMSLQSDSDEHIATFEGIPELVANEVASYFDPKDYGHVIVQLEKKGHLIIFDKTDCQRYVYHQPVPSRCKSTDTLAIMPSSHTAVFCYEKREKKTYKLLLSMVLVKNLKTKESVAESIYAGVTIRGIVYNDFIKAIFVTVAKEESHGELWMLNPELELLQVHQCETGLFIQQDPHSPLFYVEHNDFSCFSLSASGGKRLMQLQADWIIEDNQQMSYGSHHGYVISSALPSYIALRRASDGHLIGQFFSTESIEDIAITADGRYAVAFCPDSNSLLSFHIIDKNNELHEQRAIDLIPLKDSNKEATYDISASDEDTKASWTKLKSLYSEIYSEGVSFLPSLIESQPAKSEELNLLLSNPANKKIYTLESVSLELVVPCIHDSDSDDRTYSGIDKNEAYSTDSDSDAGRTSEDWVRKMVSNPTLSSPEPVNPMLSKAGLVKFPVEGSHNRAPMPSGDLAWPDDEDIVPEPQTGLKVSAAESVPNFTNKKVGKRFAKGRHSPKHVLGYPDPKPFSDHDDLRKTVVVDRICEFANDKEKSAACTIL